ncbi:MAG: hypothetical protein JW932_17485 [Deltaproteobacteria bacterium]|nr:hypothetical protein [Deltaproteobacteria bacterium]
MKIKGSAIETLPLFVKDNFREEGYQQWFDALSPEGQKIYQNKIMTSAWYPLKQALLEPTQKFCDLFYSGNLKGAWENGRVSAERGLKGVYKMFIKIGSAQFLIKKASTILPTYYDPSHIDIIQLGDKDAILHITQFEDADLIIDNRIGGWVERALEISGCKNVKVNIPKSLAKGDPVTELDLSWD